MKFKNILTVILFFAITICSYGQINSFETITSNKKTIYQTNSFESNNTTYMNQSYDLIKNLRFELKLGNEIDLKFIKNCINDTTILTKSKYLFLEFILNNEGEVLSCRLIDYGNNLTLNENQIKCILSNAININFTFSKIPTGVNSFYIKVKKQYIAD